MSVRAEDKWEAVNLTQNDTRLQETQFGPNQLADVDWHSNLVHFHAESLPLLFGKGL